MSDEIFVYIDTCCFVEVVKSQELKNLAADRKNEVWYIQKILQAHRDRAITLFTSAITIAEATHIGEEKVPASVQAAFDSFIVSGQYVFLVQPDPFICIEARNLRWNDGILLKGADAIHLASALNRNCAEFITFDRRFSRIEEYSNALSRKGIVPRRPSESRALPDKYKQEDFLN